MSVDAQETSREDGQPINLFFFQFGSQTYRYTTWRESHSFAGVNWTQRQISREDLESSESEEINKLVINTDINNEIVRKFIANVPGSVGSVQVFKAHKNDVLEETILEFDGFVGNVRMDGEINAKITCNPRTSNLRRTGPRITYQGLCNHVLYDARCKVLRGSNTYTGLASAINGSVLTVNGVSGNGADWAVGGFVQAPTGAPTDKRMVLAQSGDNLTLLLPFAEDVLNTQVDVLAGCDHSLAVCNSKFSNTDNYGGYPYVPPKNPFNSQLRGGS